MKTLSLLGMCGAVFLLAACSDNSGPQIAANTKATADAVVSINQKVEALQKAVDDLSKVKPPRTPVVVSEVACNGGDCAQKFCTAMGYAKATAAIAGSAWTNAAPDSTYRLTAGPSNVAGIGGYNLFSFACFD
jgi:hypothetical protein